MPDIIGRPVSLCVPGQRLRQVRQRHRRGFPRPDSHIQERGRQKGNHRWSATLTTLMLLLRAFYDKYGSMKNDKALKTSKLIEQCIWKTDEFDEPNKSALKIDSEVATDSDKEQFLNILKTGIVDDNWKSNYANNYRFFKKKCLMNG